MNRKPIFFTSDLHIGHANSIVFDKRPFKDLEHMHKVLINNYNSTVPANGICYFLGDIGLAKGSIVKDVISQMQGTKVCILGNHDKNSNAMYNVGFDVVLNGATLWIAGHEVTLTHCPLQGIFREDVSGMTNHKPGEHWHGESRHKQFSTPNRGQWHLHGHIHSGPANDKLRIDNRQIDIGVAGNNYKPVSISVIESIISRKK